MANKTISRKESGVSRAELLANRAAGLKRCFRCKAAKPCKEFCADKSRSDGLQPRCKACTLEVKKEWARRRSEATREERAAAMAQRKAKNKERQRIKHAERMREWSKKNSGYSQEWRRQNAERCAEVRAKWTEANRDRVKARNRKHRIANAGLYAAHVRFRQARKLRATPPWADKSKMKEFYVEAARLTQQTGVAHHVDHIYPLISDWVCGLHCEHNLQILTAHDNMSKSNRRWFDGETTGQACA